MKRFLILLVLLAMALSFAPTTTEPVAEAQDDEVLEIYITGLTEDTMNWFRDVAFPAFQEEHADVQLEILTGGWGDFDVTVAGWITTGDGPDIVYLGSEYAATFGDLLADLDPYLSDWEELEFFLPAALETATWDGHLRGLPLLMSPRPIFYRTDLAVGAEEGYPTDFETALDFYDANSIVEEGAMVQMGFQDIGGGLFDAQEFIGYIWSAGGELYNEDGTSTFDNEITADVLNYMYERRRIMMPEETVTGLPAFDGTPIASDLVVSGIFPMWNMPPVDDAIWENIGIAPYPAGAEGEPLIQVYTDWLSVPAYVEDPTLAVEFLKFITSQENAIALSEVAGFTPTRTDAWEDIRANSPVWDQLLEIAVEYGRGFNDIRATGQLRPLIVDQVTLFLTDQQSLEDTQANLKAEYDIILEENGYLD
ncbi:MAG: extracellular solute-binding protein [Chloroflexi bacterium]|nr:extracellular solute-binding protein [Chloroflexota bacterium]